MPSAIFAIGDVHGSLGLLRALENRIVQSLPPHFGDIWIVTLGDMVDRGANSAQVIDHLLSPPPPGVIRQAIAGNHEDMMLAFLHRPRRRHWIDCGGRATLNSYGIDVDAVHPGDWTTVLQSHIPTEHISYLQGLPSDIVTPNYQFIHDPKHAAPHGVAIHGHVITSLPFNKDKRINVDTGAYASGTLTAVRIVPGETPSFISASTTAHSTITPRSGNRVL